jgi:hypothetical protein
VILAPPRQIRKVGELGVMPYRQNGRVILQTKAARKSAPATGGVKFPSKPRKQWKMAKAHDQELMAFTAIGDVHDYMERETHKTADDDMKDLAAVLTGGNKALRYVALDNEGNDSGTTDAGAAALRRAIPHSAVQMVCEGADCKDLSAYARTELYMTCLSTTLRRLANNDPSLTSIVWNMRAVRSRKIEKIFGDGWPYAYFCRPQHFHQLIDDKLMARIATSLRGNTHLRILDLRTCNQITDVGAGCLMQALPLTNVSKIRLRVPDGHHWEDGSDKDSSVSQLMERAVQRADAWWDAEIGACRPAQRLAFARLHADAQHELSQWLPVDVALVIQRYLSQSRTLPLVTSSGIGHRVRERIQSGLSAYDLDHSETHLWGPRRHLWPNGSDSESEPDSDDVYSSDSGPEPDSEDVDDY